MPKTKSRKNPAVEAAKNPATPPAPVAAPPGAATEMAEKIKELVRLAQEQGHLTFNDISEALPEQQSTPEQLDEVLAKLRELEIEIVDPAEVDNVKAVEEEEEPESRHLDALDDPVRMYLKQMGAVPLLTREQEVAISKRIEQAENELLQGGLRLWILRQGTHCAGGKTAGRPAARTF